MEVIVVASFVVAFIAGVAALFAPCCITVLLPSYLGSIFNQKRTVVLMTFIFFLGLLTVFLPLGFGVAGLGTLFNTYHNEIFVIGSIFLLILGLSMLLGLRFSMPFSMGRNMNTKVSGAGSVFVLGIFSGAATLCCAPVLAGVIALSALPGSILLGGAYALVYVLGMIVPLLIIAFFVDKTNIMNRFSILNKNISYKFANRDIRITVAEMISGITFFLMGVLILYLAKTDQLTMGDGGYQTTINIYLVNASNFINGFLSRTPPTVWIILAATLVILIIKLAFFRKKRSNENLENL